jgi:CRISPR-associated endonuclease Cas1
VTSDPTDTVASLSRTFARDHVDPAVVVVDGWGLGISVRDGRLVIHDGFGRHRRTRTYERAERTIRRLVVMGRAGYITLDAMTWCRRIGVAVTVLDPDSLTISASPVASHDDARLRRVQALAAGTALGDDLARSLLAAKISGQATIADDVLGATVLAAYLNAATGGLSGLDLARMRAIEADAALAYFSGWNDRQVRFARRDAGRVPSGWHRFEFRVSPITSDNRSAADPTNAMLNYLFAVAESESVLSCHALGLDPGLGVLHADAPGRHSMALDLLEPVRPAIERYVLELLDERVFRWVDFAETPEGRCFLLPELAHELASTGPRWAALLAPWAEHIAAALVGAASGKLPTRTPLTLTRRRRSSVPLGRPPRTQRRCIECGAVVASRRAMRCPDCWSSVAAAHYRRLGAMRSESMARLRVERGDPASTPAASARRSAGQVRNRAALAAWKAGNPEGVVSDPKYFRVAIAPALEHLTTARIAEALSVSTSAASRIRSGLLVPHVRHWSILLELSRGSAVDDA